MKKVIYWILASILMVIEFPIFLMTSILLVITNIFETVQRYLSKFNRWVRSKFIPERNLIVQVKEKTKDSIWTRINDKLLTKREAEELAKEYENKGYDTYIS